jgi:hypothetical protein
MSLLSFVIAYIVFVIASMMITSYAVIGILLGWIYFKDWIMSYIPSWMIPSWAGYTHTPREDSYESDESNEYEDQFYKSY